MKKLLLTALVALFSSPIFAQNIDYQFQLKIDQAEGYLILNKDYRNCRKITNGEIITVTDRLVDIGVALKNAPFVNTRTRLNEDEIKEISFNSGKYTDSPEYAQCEWQNNVIIISDEDSKLTVNDTESPSNKYVRFNLEEGKSIETVVTLDGKSYTRSIVGQNKMSVIYHFARPSKKLVTRRAIIPGFAQYTKREYLKAGLISGVTTVALVYAISNEQKLKNSNDLFNTYHERYDISQDPIEILELIELSEREKERANDFKNRRNLGLLVVGATYIYNIIDSFIPPKFGFRDKIYFNPYVDIDKSAVPMINLKMELN